MELIRTLLNKSEVSAEKDKATFTKYVRGEIDLDQCLTDFYKNNCVKNEDQILTKSMFKQWLEGIGYHGL